MKGRRRLGLGALKILLLLLPLWSSGGGCISTGTSPSETLLYSVRDFNTELRWGRYDQIGVYLRPEMRERYLEQLLSLGEDTEIVDQELTQITVRPPGNVATARVIWSWSSKRRALMEKTTLRQDWGLRQGRWVLIRQERLSGPPLKPLEDPEPLRPTPDGGARAAQDGGAPKAAP